MVGFSETEFLTPEEHMPGYVICDIDVHDPENYEEYKKTATPTATEFGGRYIVRGGKLEVLKANGCRNDS